MNKVNKSLVQLVEELGVKAVGISGKDGGLLQGGEKIFQRARTSDLWARSRRSIRKILYDLLEKDFLPIVCPVGLDDDLQQLQHQRGRCGLRHCQGGQARRSWHF